MSRMVVGMTIEDNGALAPADGEADEEHDRQRREAQMEQELVRLVVGRLAVVAGHYYLDVLGHQRSLELGQPLDDAARR